jgi:preprotein translocase subunit SecG
MQEIILLLHVLVCVCLIALVLIQHGKGADIGAAFGSGASQTVFGSSGAGSFLMKLTGALAAIFFATSLILGYLQAEQQPQQFKLPIEHTKPIQIPGQK